MSVTVDQIATLYAQRRLAAGPEQARMREVQTLVDGDVVVPLPELNSYELSSIPNRAAEGLKQFAQRIGSAIPDIDCPALRPGIQLSEGRARDRRRALLGWWGNSRMRILLRQRARYLQGYARTPVQIRWDRATGVPVWEVRNPLVSYPAHQRGPQDLCPADCIFETEQTLGWLKANYPLQAATVSKKERTADDTRFVLLEYSDAAECVLVLLGQCDAHTTPLAGTMALALERYENRAGRCPVVYPQQIALSKIRGQFDGMIGMHLTEAKLAALAIIATQQGALGDYWLIARPNEEPRIEQIPADDGTPGIVKGGDLQRLGPNPQFQTNIMMDRLADDQMRTSGLSSEMQGVSPTNVRTGIRAQNLLSNVIDFPIQEAQELLGESLQEENRIAIAYAKAYGGQKSFYVNWEGARGEVTYEPATTFETDNNVVSYAMTGADQAGLVIAGGQRVGMETMSKQTFMRIDPLVDDPEREHDQIIGEKLEEAVLASIAQQAAQGQIAPNDVARIAELVRTDKAELFAAITKAHEEAQARQATPAPATAPETQPGLGGPAAQPGAPAPGPQDLASMLAGLRRPQQITPQEQGAA